MDIAQREPIVAFLHARGAATLNHPGGTLLAHLIRTQETLERWGADPSLVRAGLCHAAYGTVGFPVPLAELDERPDVAALIGSDAEAIVYAYCSDDRARGLSGSTGVTILRDRFSDRDWSPASDMRRKLAELSVANELDVFSQMNPSPTEREAFRVLLRACRPLLGPAGTAALDAVFEFRP
jgi:hypothetical protein